MKRFVLAIGLLAILASLSGCGSDKPPAADLSDQPNEVQEYEKRRAEEREKGTKPKAAPAGTGAPSAPR